MLQPPVVSALLLERDRKPSGGFADSVLSRPGIAANRVFGWLTAFAVLVSVSGCQLVDAGQEMQRAAWSIFRPKPFDYRDVTEEDDDLWAFVGEEGRADRPVERDPDRFWQEHVISVKARNIERSLGID